MDLDGVGIGITFMCFDGKDGVIFFVFEVTADDMLVDVDNGFHGWSSCLVARFVVHGPIREEKEDLSEGYFGSEGDVGYVGRVSRRVSRDTLHEGGAEEFPDDAIGRLDSEDLHFPGGGISEEFVQQFLFVVGIVL